MGVCLLQAETLQTIQVYPTPAPTTASTYNPVTNTWTRLPDMNAGRWYPTTTTLANGDVLVVAGMVDTTVGTNLLPQVWQTASNTCDSAAADVQSLLLLPDSALPQFQVPESI